MEFKNSKLLKRLVSDFNAVKTEQTHWNRACSMTGSGVSLLREDSLNQCALRLGWQPTWMTESQNNTRRANVPATEHEATRAFVRPINRNAEASGVPVPRFREAAADQGGSSNPSARAVDEGGSSSPPARIRRRITPPRAISRANRSRMVPSESINVESEEMLHLTLLLIWLRLVVELMEECPADHSFGVAPASVDPEPAAATVPAPVGPVVAAEPAPDLLIMDLLHKPLLLVILRLLLQICMLLEKLLKLPQVLQLKQIPLFLKYLLNLQKVVLKMWNCVRFVNVQV